jgi:hypothetical protein
MHTRTPLTSATTCFKLWIPGSALSNIKRIQRRFFVNPSPPRQELWKNNFKKMACFSAPENDHPAHHIYHAIHHKLTTKHQHKTPLFPKLPLKHQQTRGFSHPAPTGDFFWKLPGIL